MLRAIATAVACAATMAFVSMAFAEEKADKAISKEPQWKLSVQAYTFREYSLFEAIDKAKALGLKYIEAYPGQRLRPEDTSRFDHNISAEVREQVQKKLKEAGIKMVNYGVVDVGTTEASARKVFDFAKAMGIETIVSEPDPKMMETLDELTREFKINLAIHNHPKPSRYWNPEFVLQAVEGRSKRVGACADTGHWQRSGLDPTECLKKLEGRIISLHFKDLNERSPGAHDVPWGTGAGDVPSMLAELKRQGFSGVFSIEYEHNWKSSMPEIAKCIEAFNRIAKDLGVKTVAMK